MTKLQKSLKKIKVTIVIDGDKAIKEIKEAILRNISINESNQ